MGKGQQLNSPNAAFVAAIHGVGAIVPGAPINAAEGCRGVFQGGGVPARQHEQCATREQTRAEAKASLHLTCEWRIRRDKVSSTDHAACALNGGGNSFIAQNESPNKKTAEHTLGGSDLD